MEIIQMKEPLDPQFSLKSLESDFTSFRARSQANARYPEHLRNAAVEAIASGVKPSIIARALKISPTLLRQWQQRTLNKIPAESCPRILNVVPKSIGDSVPSGIRVSYEAGRLLLEISF